MMIWLASVAESILALALAVAPWLLLGLALAGIVRAVLPMAVTTRMLGGSGIGAILRAALVGAPFPLCSCGAIPAALELYRRGAGRGPATSFLVSTPGIGIDSLILSTVLLGPPMALARAIGAAALAVMTGLSVALGGRERAPGRATAGCCADDCERGGGAERFGPATGSLRMRPGEGLRYAFTDMLDDIGVWMVFGLVIAAVVMTAVPPETLAVHGSGLAAMAVVAVAGVPMYICATAATPIAVAMIASGVSPGTALVFLLAAPVTSVATLAVLRAQFGWMYLLRYVTATVLGSIAVGLVVDGLFGRLDIVVATASGDVPELLPPPVAYVALVGLTAIMIPPIRRFFGKTARLGLGWRRAA